MSLLAAGMATAKPAAADPAARVQAQQQTEWYVNDDPALFGPNIDWHDGSSGHGYGTNNFKWTYAIGGEASADNWAHWYMGDRVGQQTISVYVPRNQATATVRYNIYKDNSYFTQASIAQANVNGWTTLGTWNFDNADVVIAVFDNEAVQHWNTDGRLASRIAIDAVAMRCVSDCSSSVGPPGQVDYTTVNYVVDNESTGAGRVTWGSVLEATSYDIGLVISTERISDGTTDESNESYLSQSCCELSIAANQGTRIIAVSIRVSAVNHAGSGLWSVEVIRGVSYPVDPPPAVTGLSFSSGRISWNAAVRATAYDVEWRQTDEQDQRLAALCCELDITYVAHKDLYYRVRAKNKNGTQFGPWTSWQTHEGEEEPVPPPTTAPSGFAWIPSDSMWSGRLTWNAQSDANAYVVEWRNEGGATTRQTVQCTSSCGLGLTREPQKDLQFRIQAQNDGGSGPWSDWQVERAAIQLPGEVTGLTYSSGRLRWNSAQSETTARYDIAYKLGGESSHHMARGVSCCDLALTRPTGGSIRVAVSAINSDGRGPWTAWTTVVSADRPAKVTGLRYSNGIVRWNAASGAAFYAVAYKHGSNNYEIAENIACCQMRLAQLPGKPLKANIQGRTTERLGDWSGWTTLAEVPRPGTVSGIGYSNGKIIWQAAANADRYRVVWRINGTEHKATNVRCCSKDIGTLDAKLRVAIRGETQHGAGPWSPWETVAGGKVDGGSRDGSSGDGNNSIDCPSGNKFTIETYRTLIVVPRKRIKAAQSFTAGNGKKIHKGDTGGNVWGAGALSQSGCSWIFPGGSVSDKAKVKDNAIVYGKIHDDSIVSGNANIAKTGDVRDGAKVSGSAQIYGVVDDGAKVTGCAQIYSGGVVRGHSAQVGGDARVYGKVTGTAKVGSRNKHTVSSSSSTERTLTILEVSDCSEISYDWSNAKITADMKVDSGSWNGRAEFIRAVREWQLEIQRELYDDLKTCYPHADGNLKHDILVFIGASNESYIIGERFVELCRDYVGRIKDITEALRPTGWDIFFSVTIAFAKLFRLATAAKIFLEVLDAVKSIKNLATIVAEVECRRKIARAHYEVVMPEPMCRAMKALTGEVKKLKNKGWLTNDRRYE